MDVVASLDAELDHEDTKVVSEFAALNVAAFTVKTHKILHIMKKRNCSKLKGKFFCSV